MTIDRANLVDPAVARWYHCVTRYVRSVLEQPLRRNPLACDSLDLKQA